MIRRVGQYEILERIGRGGMGTVYKARHTKLDRIDAIKLISTDSDLTGELLARFEDEARICSQLDHPNIVRIQEFTHADDLLFIAMEFLDGVGLDMAVAGDHPLGLEEKLSVMVQACEGLEHAHGKGIVHRDLKPANLVLLRNGRLKIIDFGVAKMRESSTRTAVGNLIGTLRYMSPEHIRNQADARSDQYSLGVVFYELLAGRPPFSGTDPLDLMRQIGFEEPPALRSVEPAVPEDLAAIVERALRKDPAQRYPDLDAMRADLVAVQGRLQQRREELAKAVRERVRELESHLEALERALGQPSGEPHPAPVPSDAGVDVLEKLDRELSDRIDSLRASVDKARAVEPDFLRGRELVSRREFADAVKSFEAVLATMPEHRAAAAALESARREAQLRERRDRCERLLEGARSAIDTAAYARAVVLLTEAGELPPPSEMEDEVTALRRVAEAAQVEQEAAAKARDMATAARERMAEVRGVAQSQGAPAYARDGWAEATRSAEAGHVAFARHQYQEAFDAFDAATRRYQGLEAEVAAAKRREFQAAEQARTDAVDAREAAREAGAVQRDASGWASAEARFDEASAALDRGDASAAAGYFLSATKAWLATREKLEAEDSAILRDVAAAREDMEAERTAAESVEASRYAKALWDEGVRHGSEAAAFAERRNPREAIASYRKAREQFRWAQSSARESQDRDRRAVKEAQQSAGEARKAARQADAPRWAPDKWGQAESSYAAGSSALALGEDLDARTCFDEAIALYKAAAAFAREAEQDDRLQQETAPRPNAEVADDHEVRTVQIPHPSTGRKRLPPQPSSPVGGPEGGRRPPADLQRPRQPVREDLRFDKERPHGGSPAARPASTARTMRFVGAVVAACLIGAVALTAARFWVEQPEDPVAVEPGKPGVQGGVSSGTGAGSGVVAPPPTLPKGPDAKEQVATARARAELARAGLPPALACGDAEKARQAASQLEAQAAKAADDHDRLVAVAEQYAAAEKKYGECLALHREALDRARQAAESKQARVADARRAAEEKGADRSAKAVFDEAQSVEARADSEFSGDRYEKASELYEKAAGLYQAAGKSAGTAGPKELTPPPPPPPPPDPQERLAKTARESAREARGKADRAAAATLAADLYGQASGKEADAAALFAAGRFGEAKKAFDEATTSFGRAASAASAEKDRPSAEQARAEALAARQAAEEAGAELGSAEAYRAGQELVRKAEVEFGRREYASARKRFGDATSRFEKARLDSSPEVLRGRADAARSDAKAARSRAEASGAPAFASDEFAAAERAEQQGGASYGAADYRAALSAFSSAVELYADAMKAGEQKKPKTESKGYVSVFTEPSDGKKGGGAYGVCWRANLAEAQACARASCASRNATRPCVESDSIAPGGFCAIAKGVGYGIVEAGCRPTPAGAENLARDRVREVLRTMYPGAAAQIQIVWTNVSGN